MRKALLAVLLGCSWTAHAVDCNLNAVDDATEVGSGAVADCNANGVPDACDLFPLAFSASVVPLAAPGGAIIAAELTGDATRDLAALNPGAGTVTILAGGGDGTFATHATVTVGSAPEAIAASKLSSAVISLGSDVDLVVANGGGNSVSVLRNAGDGTFTDIAGSPFALADHPNGVAVGDLTNDGEPDLVVSRRDAGGVSVLVNDGSGGFTPAAYFKATAAGPRDVIVADLDGDGLNDALVANRGAGTVSYLHNDAGMQFDTVATVATVGDPVAIALADVDADGDLDLGVLSTADASVHLFLGDGAGHFAAGPVVATTADGTGLRLVDMDGNGTPDVVVTTSAGDAVVLARAFGAPIAVAAGDGPAGVAAADVDGDGRVDLAVSDGITSQVTVLRAGAAAARDCDASDVPDTCEAPALDCNANGIPDTCDAVSPLPYADVVRTALADTDPPFAVGDLDGDGRADVVVRRSPPKLVIALGQSDGSLVENGSFVMASTPSRLLLADVDGDGDRDVVASSTGGNAVYVFRNDGHGNVAGTDVYPVPGGPLSLGAGEFTGDGVRDLVVTQSGTSSFAVLAGGPGGFTLAPSIALAGYPAELVVGDVDGDGDADLVALVVTVGPTTALQIVRNGGGTLTAEPPILAASPGSLYIGMGGSDFDGDGDLDLAVMQLDVGSGVLRLRQAVASGGSYAVGQTLPAVQLGGPAGFVPIGLLPSMTAGDLDGDGHPDLAWPSLGGAGIGVFRNHGDGTLEPMRTIPVGGIVRGVAAGDVTGDGAADLVVPEPGSPDTIAVIPGLSRPPVDTNADGIADCHQETRCGDCSDDDDDGLVDVVDPDCPGTNLQIRRVVVAPAHGRKPAQAKLVAEASSPATFDPSTTGFGFAVGTPPTWCGTPPLRARGKRVLRLGAPDGVLGALVLQSRPKGKGFRLRATLAPLDPAPMAGDVVHAWLSTPASAFRGEATLRAKGKRLVGP